MVSQEEFDALLAQFRAVQQNFDNQSRELSALADVRARELAEHAQELARVHEAARVRADDADRQHAETLRALGEEMARQAQQQVAEATAGQRERYEGLLAALKEQVLMPALRREHEREASEMAARHREEAARIAEARLPT